MTQEFLIPSTPNDDFEYPSDFSPEDIRRAEAGVLDGASYDEMLSRYPDSELLVQYIIELRRRLCIPGYEDGGLPPHRCGRFQDLFGKWPGEIDDGFEEYITDLRRRGRRAP